MLKGMTLEKLIKLLLFVGVTGQSCLLAQNQGPVISTPLPDQILDQEGQSMDINLTNYLSDPDVTSPADARFCGQCGLERKQ